MNTQIKPNIELPSNFYNYSQETQTLIIEYLNNLNYIELNAYTIAKEHLGSSFNITKSNGYCDWFKNRK